jgi:hypothetical protein
MQYMHLFGTENRVVLSQQKCVTGMFYVPARKKIKILVFELG